MKLNSPTRRNPARRNEAGYIMLTLLLAMALMVIFAGVIVPSITFEIKHDREEEMIHRGVQYSRAIRAYYKKFGRYPTKIEDLESSNNMRFLRKRYKDPLNCKSGKCADFKLLHFGEVQMSLSGFGGGTIPGASPIGGNAGGLNAGPGGQPSTFGANSSFGASSNSSFGQNQPSTGMPQAGTDPSQAGSDTSPEGSGPNPTGPGSSTPGSSTPGSNQLGSGQIIGGPIVGVASNTPIKDSTYREFNHKKKYKDWVFVYDPAQDVGRLITTPYQPQLQGFGQAPNVNGQNGSGQPGSGFGNSNGFGTSSSGFGNSPTTPSGGGYGQQNPPSNPPQQQQ